jgi:hypothetical protein
MSNPWFRLYTEAVDDEKLRLLAFEDRWHFIALLCCKGKGILDEDNPDLIRRKVAVKLGLDPRTLDDVARRLAEVGLIDAQTLQPLAWNSRQFASDHDRTNAERQRRFRGNQRTRTPNGPVTGTVTERNGVTVTQGNVTVTLPEADADADADAESKEMGGSSGKRVGRSRAKHGADAPQPTKPAKPAQGSFPSCPDWLPSEIWHAFIDHRKAKRKPLTPQAATLTLRDLDKARRFGHDPVMLIESAISAGWTGCVFEDRHFQPIAPAHSQGRTAPLLSKVGEQQRRNLEVWLQQDAVEVTAHELH